MNQDPQVRDLGAIELSRRGLLTVGAGAVVAFLIGAELAADANENRGNVPAQQPQGEPVPCDDEVLNCTDDTLSDGTDTHGTQPQKGEESTTTTTTAPAATTTTTTPPAETTTTTTTPPAETTTTTTTPSAETTTTTTTPSAETTTTTTTTPPRPTVPTVDERPDDTE